MQTFMQCNVMVWLLDEAFIYRCDNQGDRVSKVPGESERILEIQNPVSNISLRENVKTHGCSLYASLTGNFPLNNIYGFVDHSKLSFLGL